MSDYTEMSDTRIVINIPKEFEGDWNTTRFADCIHRVMCDLRDYPNHDKMSGNYEMETLEMLLNAFENGKQLPKGCGDLVDFGKLCDDYWDGNSMEIHKDDIPNIEVIIPADKENIGKLMEQERE